MFHAPPAGYRIDQTVLTTYTLDLDVLRVLLGGETLLEELVRTASRDPERLEPVRRLIDDLRSTAEGREIVPDDLYETWGTVDAAVVGRQAAREPAEAEAVSVKRVIAYQIAELMKERRLNKTEMARRMGTSRSALERLLDPDNASVTLLRLERAAKALGKHIKVELAA